MRIRKGNGFRLTVTGIISRKEKFNFYLRSSISKVLTLIEWSNVSQTVQVLMHLFKAVSSHEQIDVIRESLVTMHEQRHSTSNSIWDAQFIKSMQ